MEVGHVGSSESKKCAVCGKKTSTYKEYEQTSITVRIPLCDVEGRRCWSQVDVKGTVSASIKLIRKEISLIAK